LVRHLRALGRPHPRCATRRKSREVGAATTGDDENYVYAIAL
jgi:hypothetical protein